MIESLDDFENGRIELGTLCSNLEGLMGAADLRDQHLRDEFWNQYAEINMEHELRSEGWAPSGSASDERLREGLDSYRRWVLNVLETSGITRR